MIEIKTFAKPKKTGGSSGSSSSTKYISGVISEAEHAARADKAKRAEVADQATYAGTAASAQNAAYASEAGNIREDAEILQQYLSLKDTVDPQVVNGMVIFAKGLMSNLLAQLKGGASFGSDGSYSFDKDGNLVIESARSRDFDEMLQNGFALKRNPTSGKYTLSISDLIVWGRMVINTLETRKKYAIGGNVYLSGASSKIQHVEKVYSEDGETVVGYKCYILKDDGTMATQNGWVVGDQALCQTFDIEEGVYQNVSNQYYWRLVTQVSEENVAITEKYIDKDGNEQIRELYEGQKFAWVVLSRDDCDTNSGIPASGDTIVLDGHRLTENEDTDYTERTNVLMLEATGSGSPRIIALTDVVDYKHTTDNEVFILSPQKVIFTTEHFEIRTASGAPITFVHFMGPWVKDTEYHYYDQVSHTNALWTCIVEKGKSTTAEPTDGSTYWRKEMSGGKGEKGDDAVSYSVQFSVVNGSANGVTSQLLYVTFTKAVGSNITSGTIEKIGFKGRVMVYVDGVENGAMSDVLNRCYPYIDISNAFAGMIEGKKNLSVKLIDTNGKVVASSIFFFAEKGDKGEDGLSGNGIVPAYIRSEDKPTLPTSTDKNNLDNGWSLTIPSADGVKNVSYNDSSWTDYNDGGYTWKKSPTTAASSTSPCLVTFTTTKANQAVKFVLKAFSEINYDYIFLSEIDASGVPSKPGYSGTSRAVSGNGVELSVEDIVVAAGTHTVYVCYGKDSSNDDYGDYGLFRIENVAGIPLWQSNGKEVFTREDSGVIKSKIESWSEPFKVTGEDGADGKDGTDGEQGESALEIIVTPETLVFDTNDNGLVPSETSKQASISCYRNGVKMTNVSYSKSAEKNCSVSVSESNSSATVTISKITSQEVVYNTSNNSYSSTVSNTSGYATIQVWDKDTNLYHRVQVKFMVNVAKFTGQMVNTNKRFSNTLTEVGTRVDGKMDSFDLNEFKAEIEQTARKISLSVSEKTIGRRNLLVGSAARRQGEGWTFMAGSYYNGLPCESIEINSGYEGVNAIHCRTKQTGTNSYYLCGFRWIGTISPQGNIKIEKGKSYTLSFWAKAYNSGYVNFISELIWQGSATDNSRPAGYAGPNGFITTQQATKNNTWTLFKVNIEVPSSAPYEYVEVNIFARATNYTLQDAYICKPMLEEGDYNCWTLSEQDYDYVGGNLLDNTRTLTVGGNLNDVGESTIISQGYGYDSAVAHADNSSGSSYKEILRWRTTSGGNMSFQKGKDYLLSFLASGSGRMTCYLFCSANNTSSIYSENNQGYVTNNAADGASNFTLSSGWKRYWVHFRVLTDSPLPTDVLMRAVIGTNVYVAQPKLEEGATMTEYTERKSDLVDKASLKAAGIEVTSEKVKLYGDQIEFAQTKSGTAFAMFKDGMIDVSLINAAKIIAERLETSGNTGQRIVIKDGLMEIFGTKNVCNIKFGVNDNGEAILSYYDNTGKWLYDLGPNKLDGSQITSSSVTIKEYVRATTKPGTNNFYDNAMYLGTNIKQVKSQYSQLLFGNNMFVNKDDEIKKNSSAHIGYQPFINVSPVIRLYRYSAPRMGNAIVKDDKYGLLTAELAKEADGKYFTSMDMASGGSLTNLAQVGVYFEKNETVRYAPIPHLSSDSINDRFPAFAIGGLVIYKAGAGSSSGGFSGFFSYLTRKINLDIIS